MKIWLLTVGEPIPQDGPDTRLLRTGQFCRWLADEGHDVTFFNSTVDHYKKLQRFDKNTELIVEENYRIICLHGRLYNRTVSYARFMSNRDVGKSFRQWVGDNNPTPPDVILTSYPTEELCRAASDYAEPLNIPIAMDCRDFWPDIFKEVLPGFARPLGDLIFSPLEAKARQTLARADAMVGMTSSAVNWGLAKAGRSKSDADFVFPFTYAGAKLSAAQKKKLKGSRPSDDVRRIVFLGTISARSGLDKFVEAAGNLSPEEKKKIEIVIAGQGGHIEKLQELAQTANAPVRFPGWLKQDQLLEIMAKSDFGLLPYHLPDFHLTIPNKLVEYLSSDLPIFSCTEGETRSLLKQQKCGLWVAPEQAEITNALREIIGSGSSEAMQAAAKKTFETTFEGKVVFNNTLGYLQALVTD